MCTGLHTNVVAMVYFSQFVHICVPYICTFLEKKMAFYHFINNGEMQLRMLKKWTPAEGNCMFSILSTLNVV